MSDLQHSAPGKPVASSTRQEVRLSVVRPRVDLFAGKDELRLVAELPGVAAEDLSLHLEATVLRLEAVGRFGGAAAERASTERTSVRYQRAFTLRADLDEDGIRASLHNGLLELRLPRAAPARRRSIPVEA